MYYYSFSDYCKQTFHKKCYKIALNAHMSCPNRDGTLGTKGCIFCSRGGSGDFAVDAGNEQIAMGLEKFGNKQVGSSYIAYFQAYTNTYAPLPYLEKVYTQALDEPSVIGISIATRPDCVPDEVIHLLLKLKAAYPEKFIWLELGLQTIHQTTADYIRRGYDLPVFEDCMKRLATANIPVILHLILGLPGETKEMIYESVSYINRFSPFGVKLQLLHFLKDTDLGDAYLNGEVTPLTKEQYVSLVVDCLERLSPDITIHRLTGDGPKDILLAPLWSLNKRDVLNSIHKECKARGAYQGRLCT